MSTQSVSFAVRGMYCPKCAGDIERALTRLDGVVAAQVNYATERARVVFDPARASVSKMVNAIRRAGHDTPLERLTLHSDDLLYATSKRSVERVLENAQGVVCASVDLVEGYITLEVLPEGRGARDLEPILARLGLRVHPSDSSHARKMFVTRGLMLAFMELVALWSAGAHAGLVSAPGLLHEPLVVAVIAWVAQFGIGWPFYRAAFDAALEGEFDASVTVALAASMFALASLPLGILMPLPWLTDIGFVGAISLTTGWFLARLGMLFVLPRFRRELVRQVVTASALGVISHGPRH